MKLLEGLELSAGTAAKIARLGLGPPELGSATWKAGVTAGNAFKKVMLNGEPVVGAVEAWASRGGLPGAVRTHDGQVLTGDVRVVPGDRRSIFDRT